ncbi:hypothetical protein PLICRDRAFT_40377 [Plicaturopsis crispa FD-325 SS-3]|nr:hypothetical protein PLICRDRAFT_40377 [Plicaturopsis crispa FD-325 SS-3]
MANKPKGQHDAEGLKQDAVSAKEKGNALFKARKFKESVDFYSEAESLDPENPVYASNLSAALYEIGDYPACFDAILRSWTQLSSQPENPALSLKLSVRLAKSLAHGVQSGVITASKVDENATAIDDLEKVLRKQPESENADHAQAWLAWRQISFGLTDRDRLAHEGRVRLSRMPIFRGTPEPYLTYFQIGMDDIMSLVDDWGPKHIDPIKVNTLSQESLGQLSFLIAGVGDGRHALGTLIGLGRMKLSPQKREALKAHVTLLDIHPAMMARNVLLFMMLNEIVENKVEGLDRLEVSAAITYLWLGVVMPPYCERRVSRCINDILDRLYERPPRMPAWLHVDQASIKPITRILEFWSTFRAKNTDIFRVHNYVNRARVHFDASNGPRMKKEGMVDQGLVRERQMSDMLDKLEGEQLRMVGERFGAKKGATLPDIRKLIQEKKKEIVADALGTEDDQNIPFGLTGEAAFYESAKVFLPPDEFWSRHPGIEIAKKLADKPTHSGLKKIAKDVEETWKPNVTIFQEDKRCPEYSLDMFATTHTVAEFNQRYKISRLNKSAKNSSTMAYLIPFLDSVVDSVRSLGKHLQCEFICGEINQELSKVRLGSDTRPNHFPKLFTRIWLSNIPDYTQGTLNTAIFVLPALQSTITAAASSNCLWNSPQWKSDDEFHFNYTQLLSKDLSRYLGVRLVRNEPVMHLLTVGAPTWPRPIGELASRNELCAWLTRLLFSTLWPGMTQPRPKLIRVPNNLVAFVCLLVHLHQVGYPGHWLGEYLQSLLFDTLVAERNVWNEILPRPISDIRSRSPSHKTRLDLWRPELEAIVASCLPGLPFAVQMPPGMATDANEIGLYEATVTEDMMAKMFNLIPIDPVISLVFYKKSAFGSDSNASAAMSKVPKAIDGGPDPTPGTLYICTSPTTVNFSKKEVTWRMSRRRVEEMRRDGWWMAAWRSDVYHFAINPVPATRWTEISSA